LVDKVQFVGWVDSLDRDIQNADIVILPSHTEGFPRVVIESMLLRTPVIATPVGGIPEAIIDGKTGLIVNVNDAEMLASAIESLIADPQLCQRLTDSAYAFASVEFSPERQVQFIEAVFEKVINDAK